MISTKFSIQFSRDRRHRATAAAAAIVGLTGLGLAGGAPVEAAEKPLVGQALVDEYTKCWGLFNSKDFAAFTACYSADARSIAPGLPPAKGGAEIVEKHAKPIAMALPDAAGELQLTLASGKNVATIALLRGTHTGPLASPGGAIPATNKKIGQHVFHSVESGNGAAAAKEWFIQDGATFLSQLGVVKQPARAPIDKGWADRPVVVASGSDTEKKNLAAMKKLYQRFAKHDQAMFDLVADDVTDFSPMLPANLVGKPAVVGFVTGLLGMSSNLAVKPTVSYAAGDYTVAIGEMVGTNDGDHPGLGIKKTGKKFKVQFAQILKWQDGKMKEIWPFFDSLELATQLGLVPPPKPIATK